ncbi:transcriptional regulator [Nocardia macrotermitis]|uniref:transcriptional regulator n=1 Tax=Nocardia macrotermitis TaxID=2585198 RepID=UPI0029E812D7|nr:transcriptional regulator [Nocardia macrotermitis]
MSAPHRRPALIILVIVAALTCLALGWWQWGRFQSGTGTGQNLGYALQWPLFAGFVVFAYVRFVRLERETDEPGDPGSERPTIVKPAVQREIPDGILPERRTPAPAARRTQDPVLADYNRYLADLHAQDLHEQMRAAGLDARETERSAG